MKYIQPVINIEESEFVVDVNNFLLWEKNNPHNTIQFSDMKDTGDGYEFEYCRDDKNIPFFFYSDNSVMVKLPALIELDPEGMAMKYNFSVQDFKGKTDFDIMVDKVEYDKRVFIGILPILDIAGHTFYVDLRMDMLRPKDDFLSKGIVFSKLDGYYIENKEKYLIPYNPETREFQEPNYHAITEFPKDLIAIEIPMEKKLDPVGWNRKMGLDPKADLKWVGLRSQHTATIIPWKDTPLLKIIDSNLLLKQKKELKKDSLSDKPKGKGRRI
ncbi:hypothetical protein RAH57_03710 [Chryseobacterium sp. CKR4-1]|uniref:hypothetical protein n=1 Tax=Chryseobacterium sp. CKR4-1 TaxID=3068896 RepID=UPI002796914E|nr:hypothetical protein [Chryseobacterium sp. CKR4-1]MDQ1803077.1 hypothetical protein [Chryseobacterium sp. CKR4-1]